MTPKPARGTRASTTIANGGEFSFSSGALYGDKDEYITKNLVFAIGKIIFEKNAGYEPGSDRWAITVSVDDGRPDEIITMQSNEGRDAELRTAAEHIAKHGAIRNVRLVKSGKAYYFRNAAETKLS